MSLIRPPLASNPNYYSLNRLHCWTASTLWVKAAPDISNVPCVSWLYSKWWGPGWSAPLNLPESRSPPQDSCPGRGSYGRAVPNWDTAVALLLESGSRYAWWCCDSWKERLWQWLPRGLGHTSRTPGLSDRSGHRQSNPSGLHHPECMLWRTEEKRQHVRYSCFL